MTSTPGYPTDQLDPDWTADLELALRLADQADAITTARFRSADLVVTSKPDLSPVSDADQAVEALVRQQLATERPDDAFCGEESGSAGSGPRTWVLDPIDGTKNFVRGVPVWASLLALLVDGEPVLGVVSAPALGQRWWAARGHGAFGASLGRPARRLRVSAVDRLADAEPVLRLAVRLGRHRPAAGPAGPDRAGLAVPGLRRLLVLHAGCRGRGGPGRRA